MDSPAHLMFCLRRQPHLSRQQFQQRWREVHGPMVLARSDAMGLAGYVQSHALPEGSAGALARARGSPPDFDGVAQLWWHARTMTAAEKEAARRASAELLEDERQFIDLAASPIFLVQDHELLRLFMQGREPGVLP